MIFTIIISLFILGITIFIHEFGHFIFAKKRGVKVEEFGFGYPPRIFGWKKVKGKRKLFFGNKKSEEISSEDTIYSLNLIPIGGFVKIKGEAGENEEDKDSFASKKIWERGLIIFGGVLMNFVLAAFLLSIGFYFGLPQVIDKNNQGLKIRDKKIQIVSVLKSSPADKAGFKLGDEILQVNEKKIDRIDDFQKIISQSSGQVIKIKIRRFDRILDKEVTPEPPRKINNLPWPEQELKKHSAIIGIGLVETGIISYPWYLALWKGVKTTLILIWKFLVIIFLILKNLIIKREMITEVSGPIGIVVLTGKMARLGFIYLLQFTALLSLNLGIINILPIPALDGGKLFFLLLEKIRGKRIKPEIENAIHTFGFVALMCLVLVVTYYDIARFGGKIIGTIKKTIGG